MQEIIWGLRDKLIFVEKTGDTPLPLLRIGEPVFACNKRCGTLYKVVVDPNARRVTHIVVHKGWFLTEDRLVPIERLEHAEVNAVFLKAASPALKQYPSYREEAFVKPWPDWEALKPFAIRDTLFWGSPSISAGTASLVGEGPGDVGGAAANESVPGLGDIEAACPDPEIYADLNARLQAKPALSAVQVRVAEGQVLLFGNVATSTDKDSAEAIARDGRGVAGVENTLTSDTDLFARVSSELATDPLTAAVSIKVVVDRGVVTLNGSVAGAQARAAAEAMALRAPGGMMVINKIKIAANP